MSASANFSDYALIGIGANLPSAFGSPIQTLKKAAGEVATLSDQSMLSSSFWQSEPLDCPPGSPIYINAVLGIVPKEGVSGLTLLHTLQWIENEFGRNRSGLVNESRVLDLDLLSFKQEIITHPELIVPHPRAHERLFVLRPLQQIFPEFRFVGLDEDLEMLIERIDDQPLFQVAFE